MGHRGRGALNSDSSTKLLSPFLHLTKLSNERRAYVFWLCDFAWVSAAMSSTASPLRRGFSMRSWFLRETWPKLAVSYADVAKIPNNKSFGPKYGPLLQSRRRLFSW